MSKRHTTSRRRAYGRRQHELHERVDRRDRSRPERAWRHGQDVGLEPLAFIGGRENGRSYGFSD